MDFSSNLYHLIRRGNKIALQLRLLNKGATSEKPITEKASSVAYHSHSCFKLTIKLILMMSLCHTTFTLTNYLGVTFFLNHFFFIIDRRMPK